MNYSTTDTGAGRHIGHLVRRAVMAVGCVALAPLGARAQTAAMSHSGNPCPRPAAGSIVMPPPNLFSYNGTLSFGFNYFTTTDSDGRSLFCFVTADSHAFQSPTLHVKPG